MNLLFSLTRFLAFIHNGFLVYFSVLELILYKKFPTCYDSVVCNTSMLTSIDDMDEKIKEFEKRLDKIEEDKTKSEV